MTASTRITRRPLLRHPRRLRAAALLAAMLGALGAAPPPALADGDPATDGVPRMLPYQGRLEVDGRPVEATGEAALNLLFSLYDGPAAEQPVYSQPLVVEVYAGRFTATIGPVGEGPDGTPRPIGEVIAAADDLYLGITLLGNPADPEDDIALSNRQRIYATPYAMWSTSATNLSVAGQARVAGDATVGGDVVVGGALRVDGQVDLPVGAIGAEEIEDFSLLLDDFDAAFIGEGLRREGDRLALDPEWVDARVRSWVREHCTAQLGWRDSCNNCDSAPAKTVTVKADGTCIGAVGADTRCRSNNTWGGVNTDGGVDGSDVFYIRMVCN